MSLMVIIILCSLLTSEYVVLMLLYWRGWQQQKEFTPRPGFEPATFISVIIPARNEQERIEACIASILAQQYPQGLFEIIVVDDHSEDNTASIVKKYAHRNVRYISLRDHMDAGVKTVAYKKAAINAGIENSIGSLIVTTDADCIAPERWLLHMAAIYEQQHPAMIIAPVVYSCDGSLLQVFQFIDFMSMQGITAAAHKLQLGNMSNGANLAFSKVAYMVVGGYAGTTHMASGDDYLLLMKMSMAFPGGIAYLRSENATMSTPAQTTWRGFIQQRIRWASKSGKYDDVRLTMILLMVYIFNLSFVVLTVAGIFHQTLLYIAGAMLVLKIIKTQTAAGWKRDIPQLGKVPAVFLMLG